MQDRLKKMGEWVAEVFTRHPRSIHETYWEHFGFAFWCGARLIVAGIVCIIHSIFPFVFETTASGILEKVSTEMRDRKNK